MYACLFVCDRIPRVPLVTSNLEVSRIISKASNTLIIPFLLPPVGEIHSFLGLAGYHLRFIENFSKIAKPMTELLKKDTKFKWTEECETSF